MPIKTTNPVRGSAQLKYPFLPCKYNTLDKWFVIVCSNLFFSKLWDRINTEVSKSYSNLPLQIGDHTNWTLQPSARSISSSDAINESQNSPHQGSFHLRAWKQRPTKMSRRMPPQQKTKWFRGNQLCYNEIKLSYVSRKTRWSTRTSRFEKNWSTLNTLAFWGKEVVKDITNFPAAYTKVNTNNSQSDVRVKLEHASAQKPIKAALGNQ